MPVTIHHSTAPTPELIAAELLAGAQPSNSPRAGLLLMSKDISPQPVLDALMDAYPEMILVGGTTLAEMSSQQGMAQGSAVLVLFSAAEIGGGVCRALSAGVEQSVTAGLENSLPNPSLALVLAESLGVGGDAVAREFSRCLGSATPIFGGLTADSWDFKQTYQFFGREIFEDAAVFLLFGGDGLEFSYAVESGWQPLGEPALVTASTGNQVQSIDGEPAIEFYNRYVGGWPEVFGEYPLQVTTPEWSLLRAPLNLDAETGAILFAGDVPVNASVQIATADRRAVLSAVTTAIESARSRLSQPPALILVSSCAARFFVLGTQAGEEVAEVERQFPNVPVAGFYGYGELAPGMRNMASGMLHNETFVFLMLALE